MRIAAYQFAVSDNINSNYEKIAEATRIAKSNSARLVIFPECALTGYPPRDIQSSSDVDFDLVELKCTELQKLSDENDIAVICGTIYKDRGIRNRAILFRPGKPREFYDKKALWGWDKDNFTATVTDYLKLTEFQSESEYVLKSGFRNVFGSCTGGKPTSI